MRDLNLHANNPCDNQTGEASMLLRRATAKSAVVAVFTAASLLVATLPLAIAALDDEYVLSAIGSIDQSFSPTAGFGDTVDEFSGNVLVNVVDFTLPGNGGLDIVFQRRYRRAPSVFGEAAGNPFDPVDLMGNDWVFHFGRIISPTEQLKTNCTAYGFEYVDSQYAVRVDIPGLGNASLYGDAQANGYDLAAPNGVVANCIPATALNADGTTTPVANAGFEVHTPDGRTYTFDILERRKDRKSVASPYVFHMWQVSRIEDRFGNWLAFSYHADANGYVLLDQITSSDGRQVDLAYTQVGSGATANLDGYGLTGYFSVLDHVSYEGHTWNYEYDLLNADLDLNGYSGTGHEWERVHLSAVVRPDGSRWEYDYYGPLEAGSPSGIFYKNITGYHRLHRVTNPLGATVEFTYQTVTSNIERPPNILGVLAGLDATMVASRTVSGPSIDSGTWTYGNSDLFVASSIIRIVDSSCRGSS